MPSDLWFTGTRSPVSSGPSSIIRKGSIHQAQGDDLAEGSVGSKKLAYTIQSDNFVAGASGWQIKRDGTAEFNDVTVRGTLQTGTTGIRIVISAANADLIQFIVPGLDSEGYIQTANRELLITPPFDSTDTAAPFIGLHSAAGGAESITIEASTLYFNTANAQMNGLWTLVDGRLAIDQQSTGLGSTPHRWDFISAMNALHGVPDGTLLLWDNTVGAERMRWGPNGNVVIGDLTALATTATDKFLHIPTMAGAATGTPTAFGGKVPIVYDTTNNRLRVYNGAWKSVALA